MYRLVLLAGLLLCGCGGDIDSKPAQGSAPSPPTVLTTNVVTASNAVLRRDADTLSDEGQIRVLACEYILRNQLMNLTNRTLFVSLTNVEVQALAGKLPAADFARSIR
jgi:hypothetical protein